MNDTIQSKIHDLVHSNDVVLFMKGNRIQPQCGFSARVVEVLDQLLPSYKTEDILLDSELREGVKVFSSWPTIPQLYVKGEFIGGCDIICDLMESGELAKLLGINYENQTAPSIQMSNSAIDAFQNALENASEEDAIRLQISAKFEHTLSLDQKKATDHVIQNGKVRLLIDPSSASRAEGLKIDYHKSTMGAGFQMENPNAPKEVQQISPTEVKQRLDAKEALYFFDVRTQQEWETAHVKEAKLLLNVPQEELDALDKNAPIVFMCHHGGRSQRAAVQYHAKGFKNVYNLAGGIDAWSTEIDPTIARY